MSLGDAGIDLGIVFIAKYKALFSTSKYNIYKTPYRKRPTREIQPKWVYFAVRDHNGQFPGPEVIPGADYDRLVNEAEFIVGDNGEILKCNTMPRNEMIDRMELNEMERILYERRYQETN